MGITEMGKFERKFWGKHCGYLREEPSWQGAACAEALRVESSSCDEGFGLLPWVKLLPLWFWREKWVGLTWVLIYSSIWLTIDYTSFPGGSAGKESTRSARDPGSIPGTGDPLEKG